MTRVMSGPSHALSKSKSEMSSDMLDDKPKSQLQQIFNSANGPAISREVEPSKRLCTIPKEHQKKALSMMMERERGALGNAQFDTLWEVSTKPGGSQFYRDIITGKSQDTRPTIALGGILADDMGLGKTLSISSLITTSLDAFDVSMPLSYESSRTTLFVCPKSAIVAWQQQIARHIHPGHIRVGFYHGSSKVKSLSELHANDIILTTYGTVLSEGKTTAGSGPLFPKEWARVVLDEAHHIRDRSSKIFKATCDLPAKPRWCMTGTPIQNRLDDYGSLLTFIGIAPLASKSTFNFWIAKPLLAGRPEGLARLRRLVTSTCLRRTKDSIRDDLELPPRIDKECMVRMDHEDQELYNFFQTRVSGFVSGLLSNDKVEKSRRNGHILPLINILRLICNHGQSLVPQRVQQV
ncbi:SNF2 family N-terminal domain-containing protein [Hypoxylon cercidicola]|nr:SNF2 family N-terminal domain-containing protein [Hypoxylon cercidicola]